MARLLCVTSDMPGMLFPAVELSRRLARVGHELTYSSPEAARPTVAAAGIDFTPLEPGRFTEFLEGDAKTSRWRRIRSWRSRRAHAAEAIGAPSLESTLRRVEPDLLLIDGELHAEIITAVTAGVPVALLNSFVSIWRRPGLPPPHCLVVPGEGWRGSTLGIWLLWKALRLRKRVRAQRLALRHLGCDYLSALARLARDRGFDLRRETDAGQWLIPFSYRNLPVLSLHAEEFEFPHRPPPQVRYVGPMLLASRGDAVPSPVHAELQTIYARCRESGQSLIFAAFGSFLSTDLAFLQRLIEAVARREDWVMVLGLGGRLPPEALGERPDNIHVFDWVPQVDVLRHADVAVTHGGINTVDECMLTGVPSLAYCGSETDMAGTTARLVHHGLGLAGERRDSPARIAARIDRLLSEPAFRDNVRHFRQLYAAYEAEGVAERAVATLLEDLGDA